jgi:hypothetical protein
VRKEKVNMLEKTATDVDDENGGEHNASPDPSGKSVGDVGLGKVAGMAKGMAKTKVQEEGEQHIK